MARPRSNGRPRNAAKEMAPSPIVEISASVTAEMAVSPEPVAVDVMPRLHQLTPTATRGGMYRRPDTPISAEPITIEERMAEVMALLERAKNYNAVIQEHNYCVTMTVGKYSECINVTAPNKEIERFINRVVTAGAN